MVTPLAVQRWVSLKLIFQKIYNFYIVMYVLCFYEVGYNFRRISNCSVDSENTIKNFSPSDQFACFLQNSKMSVFSQTRSQLCDSLFSHQ